MKKTIYVAKADRINGDSFDIKVTYVKSEAQRAIKADLEHLTKMERKAYEHWIDYKSVDVEDGESAVEAYERLLDGGEW